MLSCFSVLRLGRCRGRVRFAVLPPVPLNGAMSKLFPSVVETATGLAGSTLSNSSTGLSRISANEFPCRTSILIISSDSLYIHCITVQAQIFYPNIRLRDGIVSDLDDNVLFRPPCINVEYAPRRLLRQGAHSGPKEILCPADVAQRLQGCDRLEHL